MINPRRHIEKIRKARLSARINERIGKLAKEKLFSLGGLFVWLVILPTLASIIYFGPIASDVYISQSRFLVRSPQQDPQVGLGGILATVGMSKNGQDGFIVVNYIESMDAMLAVSKRINILDLFTSKQIDIFNRFASFYWNTSNERLLNFFNDHIDIVYDPQASIAILTVRAFTSQSAYDINLQLLENSEALVNRMSDEARQDLIDFASFEVNAARVNLEKADAALIAFRNQGNADNANFIAKFQQLQLERDTAEKQLASAISALEQARIDAQRKRLYIERIVQPNLPDYPLEPKRVYGIVTTFLISLIVWGIVKMVVAGVKEHHA